MWQAHMALHCVSAVLIAYTYTRTMHISIHNWIYEIWICIQNNGTCIIYIYIRVFERITDEQTQKSAKGNCLLIFSVYNAKSAIHASTNCNTLQHMNTIGKNATQTATRCNKLQHMYTMLRAPQTLQHSTIHCNTCVQWQERNTHWDSCNTLQHMHTMTTALQTLQHTAIHFNTRIKRQERKTHCNTRMHEWMRCVIGLFLTGCPQSF